MTLLPFSGSAEHPGQRALGVVVTPEDCADPATKAAELETGLIQWRDAEADPLVFLMFTFMAGDMEQSGVLQFMKAVIARPTLAAAMGQLQLQMQFPQMSEPVADNTHGRILRYEFDDAAVPSSPAYPTPPLSLLRIVCIVAWTFVGLIAGGLVMVVLMGGATLASEIIKTKSAALVLLAGFVGVLVALGLAALALRQAWRGRLPGTRGMS
jgi:hypothetical protein